MTIIRYQETAKQQHDRIKARQEYEELYRPASPVYWTRSAMEKRKKKLDAALKGTY